MSSKINALEMCNVTIANNNKRIEQLMTRIPEELLMEIDEIDLPRARAICEEMKAAKEAEKAFNTALKRATEVEKTCKGITMGMRYLLIQAETHNDAMDEEAMEYKEGSLSRTFGTNDITNTQIELVDKYFNLSRLMNKEYDLPNIIRYWEPRKRFNIEFTRMVQGHPNVTMVNGKWVVDPAFNVGERWGKARQAKQYAWSEYQESVEMNWLAHTRYLDLLEQRIIKIGVTNGTLHNMETLLSSIDSSAWAKARAKLLELQDKACKFYWNKKYSKWCQDKFEDHLTKVRWSVTNGLCKKGWRMNDETKKFWTSRYGIEFNELKEGKQGYWKAMDEVGGGWMLIARYNRLANMEINQYFTYGDTHEVDNGMELREMAGTIAAIVSGEEGDPADMKVKVSKAFNSSLWKWENDKKYTSKVRSEDQSNETWVNEEEDMNSLMAQYEQDFDGSR
jgi:hypothetical protein